MDSIREVVRRFILDNFLPGEDPKNLTDETELKESGILDSLSTLKLVTFLEEQYKVEFEANDLDADWNSVSRAENAMLVNALSMMAPYGPAEKQALLEAPDLKSRAETLIALTEMALARDNEDFGSSLQ